MKNLLEKKDCYYYIYENGDTIELSVPISAPAPGFDAIHKLTDPEKKEYLTKGITGPNKRHGNEFYQVCFEFLEVIFRII